MELFCFLCYDKHRNNKILISCERSFSIFSIFLSLKTLPYMHASCEVVLPIKSFVKLYEKQNACSLCKRKNTAILLEPWSFKV